MNISQNALNGLLSRKAVLLLGVILILPGLLLGQKLVHVWDTPQTLKTPESVCYHPDGPIIFVSNINGNPTEKDGNGFISKVTPNGKIEVLKWVEGLNAPKGMGIIGDKLYVSDIDRIVELSISGGKILNAYDVPGAIFLNDIDVDANGNVYVSDSRTNKVHKLSESKVSTLITLDAKGTNGLFVDGNSLLIGVSGKVIKVDLNTLESSDYITDTGGGIDGLEKTSMGVFVISDWRGKTHLIFPDKSRILLLDTTEKNINAADLDFVPEKNIVLIPTFSDNRVRAYTLEN